MKTLNTVVSLALLLPTLSFAQVSRYSLAKPVSTSNLLLQPYASKAKLLASDAIKNLTLNPLRRDIQITLINKDMKMLLNKGDLERLLTNSKISGKAYSIGSNSVFIDKIERQGDKITLRVLETNEKYTAQLGEKLAARKMATKGATSLSRRLLGKVVALGAVGATGIGLSIHGLLKPQASTEKAAARLNANRSSGKNLVTPRSIASTPSKKICTTKQQ